METKISVIIPVYNREELVKRAINSVINQTFGFNNIELIIVDNNSSDNTKKVIESFSHKYENIIPIFRKTNSGSPNIPRNNGIECSNSEYIMFLDSDDVYNVEICEKLYGAIEKYNTDFVECWYKDKSDYIVNSDNNSSNNNSYVIHTHMEKDLSNLSGMMWNKLYKKSFLIDNNIRCPSDFGAEDVYFSYLCYSNTDQWIEVKYVGYLHEDDSTHLAQLSGAESTFVNCLEGYNLTYQISKEEKKNAYLAQFPLQHMPARALELLRLDYTRNQRKKILNKYFILFKNYNTYESLPITLRVFYKIFSFNVTMALLISQIYNFLLIENIIRNKTMHNFIMKFFKLYNNKWGD